MRDTILLTALVVLSPLCALSQSTVGAGLRQPKAGDFVPVTLPPLTPSVLQTAVSPSRPQAAVAPDFKLDYDSSPWVFVYPNEPKLIRSILVKNNGPYAELQFSAVITGPNNFSKPGDTLGITPLPQPSYLYLQPGESQQIWISVNWFDLDTSSWQAGGSNDYVFTVSVSPRTSGGQPTDPTKTQVATLRNTVRILYVTPGNPASVAQYANATISGVVTDSATGKPISRARVQLFSSTITPAAALTDALGAWSIKLPAFQEAASGVWHDYGVTVQAQGYSDSNTAVAPHADDTISIDTALNSSRETASYAVASKYDLVENINRGDVSKDGKYLAVVNFHSSVPPGENPTEYTSNAKLSFFSTEGDGGLLWQFPLYQETPCVAVSDDGALVATARPNLARPDNGIYVLDNHGNVVWFAGNLGSTNYNFYEVRFSHDNKYVAAGDTQGVLYLVDLAARKVVWKRFLGGQIRQLAFENDNTSLWAGSGDGYLYSFQIDGSVNWRTYVGGWPLAFAVSRNFLMTFGKEGSFISLVKKDGSLIWEYPTWGAEFLSIAPDESHMLAATTNGAGTQILNSDGVLVSHAGNTSPDTIASDGLHMLWSGQVIDPGTQMGQIYVKLLDGGGSELWRGTLDSTIHRGPTGGFAWISPDNTKLVVANGNWIYFLRGSVSGAPPTISSVTDAASLRPNIVAGEWITITGTNLADTTRIWNADDFANGSALPTTLSDVGVTVNGIPAAVYYISPTQLNVQAPAPLDGAVAVRVTHNGLASNTLTATAIQNAPSVFVYTAGSKTYPAAIFPSGLVVGDPSLSGAAVSKARPGDTIEVYATGLASAPAGTVISAPITLTSPVSVTIGTAEATVEYAGLVAPGEFQINVAVPNLSPGEYPITVRVVGQSSQPGVLLPIMQ